jgi:hypothetical protein
MFALLLSCQTGKPFPEPRSCLQGPAHDASRQTGQEQGKGEKGSTPRREREQNDTEAHTIPPTYSIVTNRVIANRETRYGRRPMT